VVGERQRVQTRICGSKAAAAESRSEGGGEVLQMRRYEVLQIRWYGAGLRRIESAVRDALVDGAMIDGTEWASIRPSL
jgi:hypothetical protein